MRKLRRGLEEALRIVAVGVSMFVSGCVSTDWQTAKNADSVDSYTMFLQRHPDTQYSSEADSRIVALKKNAAEAERRAAKQVRAAKGRQERALQEAVQKGDLEELCRHEPEQNQVETVLATHWTTMSSSGLEWLEAMADQQGYVTDVSRSGTLSTTDGVQHFEFTGLTRLFCRGKRLIFFRSARLGSQSLAHTCIYGDQWYTKK